MWIQKEIVLAQKPRGFHLITHELMQAIPEIQGLSTGLCHIFIQHTSASLAINENADPDVRTDMEAYFSRTAPENEPYFTHVLEGSDDMPAQLKNVMLGCQLTMPVTNGRLNLGAWQGVYLCEHRNQGGVRHLVVTLQGE